MNLGSISNEAWIGIGIAIAVLVLVVLVLLRSLSGGKPEVKLADAVIALIPIVIVLFMTGKIEKLGIGPSGVTIEAAFVRAFEAKVVDQVVKIDRVLVGPKGLMREIPYYVRRGVEALTFRIGGRYVPGVIEAYFRELTQSTRFKYFIVVERERNRFFGMMEARQLLPSPW